LHRGLFWFVPDSAASAAGRIWQDRRKAVGYKREELRLENTGKTAAGAVMTTLRWLQIATDTARSCLALLVLHEFYEVAGLIVRNLPSLKPVDDCICLGLRHRAFDELNCLLPNSKLKNWL
jgi:hypothetical protein